MPTPSLVNIPFITAPNVLFSQIPESGAGDFTVTRTTSPVAGQSTRVNAAGFIELVADNVARLDYPLGGAVNGCPALLVEPSAVNLALQSENFTPATWGLVNMVAYGSGSVLDSTATRDPYGTNVADFIVPNTTLGQHRADQTTVSAAGSYTFSVFLKSGGYDFARLRIGLAGANFNLANGTITATDTGIVSAIQSYGNGWYRCIISKASSAANEIIRVNVADSASAPDFQGNGTSGLYFFGAQYETGTVPTSYIPTTTQAITRVADVIRKTGITSLIGQSEGTVYFEVEVTSEVRDRWFCSLDSSAGSFIQMVINPSRAIIISILNGGTQVITNLTSSVLSVGYHKVAFAYNTATNGCIMYIDGVQNPVATRTVVAPGLPAFNNMSFGTYFSTTTDTLKGRVRAGAVYPNRISNLDLEFLTAPVTYTTYAQMANALSYILP
jgi:hypothetical protein